MISPFEPRQPRLLLSIQTIVDEADEQNLHFSAREDDAPLFRGFRVYDPHAVLRSEILYVLTADTEGDFPCDTTPYVTVGQRSGAAPHICFERLSALQLCEALNAIFQRYHDFEAELNGLIQNDGDLDDLCRLGSSFFENPMYIHDSLFTILAQPCFVEGMLVPDKNPETGKEYIPLWLIEDFKFNKDYTETLRQQQARIWGKDQYPYHLRTLYVNIWDGDLYRARLLINELHTPLRPSQFKLAEYLAHYIRLIMRMDERNVNRHYRNLEDTVRTLIGGHEVDRSDLRVLLTALGWREEDEYLCIKCQSQSSRTTLGGDNSLRSAVTAALSEVFTFFYEQSLCVIVDLTSIGCAPSEVRSKLAPLLRDSYMYAGFSMSLPNFLSVGQGFCQADIALDRVLKRQDADWLSSFDACACDYLLSCISSPISTELLVSPVLRVLRRHDREHGTEYYRTLFSYLRNERSIPRCSEQLIIHRSTLMYRMEKIQELTKIDLNNPQLRLYLLLSFRLTELREADDRASLRE